MIQWQRYACSIKHIATWIIPSPVYMIAVVHSLAASSMLYRDSRDSYRIFCLGGELIKTWMKISVKGSSP